MTNWADVEARCPFYRGIEKNTLTCEGILEDSYTIRHYFKSREICKKQKREYCDSFCYDKCKYYKILTDRKYKE